MKQTKPDRFERLACKIVFGKSKYIPFSDWRKRRWYVDPDHLIKLLRREHQAVVRMVKRAPKVRGYVSDMVLRQDLLALLKKRA